MTRFQRWFNAQTPRGQWSAGCAGVIAVIALCLYGLGLFSYVARPTLVAIPPVATVVYTVPAVAPPTFVVPTAAPPTFALPGSTLVATPTQAPIPTRSPPTETPTPLLGPDGLPIPLTTTPDATQAFELSQTPQP